MNAKYKAPSITLFKPLFKAVQTKLKEPKYKLQDSYTFQGLPISVENKAGSIRKSKPGEKPKWRTKMGYDYGYIRNTEAKDKEAVDVYVNRKSKGKKAPYHDVAGGELVDTAVYVIHQKQIWKTGKWHNGICPDCHKHHSECKHAYDEDKVMLGFDSKEEAIKAYLKQYDSPRFLGPVSTFTLPEFKASLKRSFGKKLPYSNGKHEHWFGFDLDGTLAHDNGWKGKDHIGEPIKKTVELIEKYLKDGKKVKIFTARAYDKKAIPPIKAWLKINNLPQLEITNKKDPGMIMLYDDRAVQVRKNTGNLVKGLSSGYLVKGCMKKQMEDELEKSYLGQPGDPGGSHAMLKENLGAPMYLKTPSTMSGVLEEIEKSYATEKEDGEPMDFFVRRKLREFSGNQVAEMHNRKQSGVMEKAFVKQTSYTNKQGKLVHRKAYIDKRQKKVTHVKHEKMTRMDLDSKKAK
ncbi:hypothetical protein KA005_72225, partial [bacterium]|nr:hypothetical protein [bacterium]